MRAIDFMPRVLADGLSDVPVDAVRVSRATAELLEAGRNQVSVVWRTIDQAGQRLVDGTAPVEVLFRVECRADDQECAVVLADEVLDVLAPYMTRLDTRYDEEDDGAQQKFDVYSHVLEVGLPVDGLPEV